MSLALEPPYSPSTTAWETEDEMSQPASSTLTTPMDANPRSRGSRNSSRTSRRSRRSITPPGRITKSPPPMPGSDKTDKSDRVVRDLATDDKISILDPRRFTPTLHANLVGEILTLKRDQDEKLQLIEALEATLQTTRAEGDSREATLLNTSKENRSLKRQLALLEGGISSALGELARERDEAFDNLAEARKRLETAQKKLKTQEDAAVKANEEWLTGKDAWEEERRKTDRKIHLLETRLKMVLEEMASYHANAQQTVTGAAAAAEEDEDEAAESDSGSIRTMSVRNSLRFSLLQRTNGHSLADELDFDDDSDYQTETNGRDSAMSTPKHARSGSRASILSRTHHRHQYSVDSLGRTNSIARARYHSRLMQGEDQRINHAIREDDDVPRTASYTDTGVQYSPPPSPKAAPAMTVKPQPPVQEPIVQAMAAKWEKHWEEGNHEANQRKKRVTLAKPLVIQPAASASPKLMVSAGAQTLDIPLSPPKTPKPASQDQEVKTAVVKEPAAMVSAATQTDAPAAPRPVTPPSPSLAIPSITVHPPTSLPASPKQHRLPQYFKDFACQVSLPSVPMTSTAVQTEEIRVDQRLDRLPPHLHPSAITSRPNSPAVGPQIPTSAEQQGQSTPLPEVVPPRNPRRLASIKSFGESGPSPRFSVDSEAKGSLDLQKSASRRSHRISSLFSDPHDGSSADEMDDFADHHLSDTEFSTALSAPRAVKSPEPGRSTPDSSTPDSPSEAAILRKASNLSSPVDMLEPTSTVNRYKLSGDQGIAMPRRESSSRGLRLDTKSGNIRKAAMIQNGLNTHQDETNDPPFPIPARASSRLPAFSSGSRNADSRGSTKTDAWRMRATHYRKGSLRKKSVSRNNRRKPSRSPSISPSVSQSPTVSCLPTSFRQTSSTRNEGSSSKRGHLHQNSQTTATTEMTTVKSQKSSQNANGVVDAIAQAMVGEWMFKYVRRRKSFGMPTADHSGKDDSSNDRHKRWVWLAPYERAILWSSKQPSSGSALLGKSGRKLAIQSVLDVKDDNPAPKGQLAVFNRSILILTPQRALKFTAINAERHYLWLTALSFLAHSQQEVPTIPTSVPKQAPNFELSPEQAKIRRPRIRDSIRLAKSHNPLSTSHTTTTTSTGSYMGADSASLNRDFAVPMMPSIPDFPTSLIPGGGGGGAHRSSQMTAVATNDILFGYPSYQQQNHHAPTSDPNSHPHHAAMTHEREASNDSAMPPAIPRFGRDYPQQQQQQQQQPGNFHGRKRSNTGGHIPPPLSFRGFGGGGSGGAPYGHTANNYSQSTDGGPLSADVLRGSGGGAGVGASSEWGSSGGGGPLGRNSEASSWRDSIAGSTGTNNLFEAIGTVRMEAFISPLAYSRYETSGGNGHLQGLQQLEYANTLLEEDMMMEDEGSRVMMRAARKRTKEKRRQKSRSRSRSRTRYGHGGSSFSRGGVAAWKEEYYGYGGGGGRSVSAQGYAGGMGMGMGSVIGGDEDMFGGGSAGGSSMGRAKDPFEGF